MKKIVIASMLAFAAFLGGNQLYKGQTVSNLSEIMKANIEALADGKDDLEPCKGCSIDYDGSYCCTIFTSWGYVVLRADNGFHPGEWD